LRSDKFLKYFLRSTVFRRNIVLMFYQVKVTSIHGVRHEENLGGLSRY
jgi:hypothetical protein